MKGENLFCIGDAFIVVTGDTFDPLTLMAHG